MDNLNEEKKPKKFNKRVKKRIAFGVLGAVALTGITFTAIRLSHQEKPGKVIPIDFKWGAQHLETESGKQHATRDFVYAFCTALGKYRDELQALVNDPKTDWASRKETTFKLGPQFIGGDNYTNKINSRVEAIEAIKQMNKYLHLSADQYSEKLRFIFTNPLLKEILKSVRDALAKQGIPWQQ